MADRAEAEGRGGTGRSGRVFRHAVDAASKPPARPTNGGPRVYATPLEELEDIGRSMYAPDAWIPRLAKDLGEHPRQLRKWISGERRMPDVVLVRARAAVKRNIARLERLLVRLDEPGPGPG